MKLSAKLLPQLLTVRALSPKARTDLMIAAIPFALALAAKGLEALERHIAGRLAHLTELELAIAKAHGEWAQDAGGAEFTGAAHREAQNDDDGAVIAHPAGCVLFDEGVPGRHDGECVFPTPAKVSVDDELPEIPQCEEPFCRIGSLHNHGLGTATVNPAAWIAAPA